MRHVFDPAAPIMGQLRDMGIPEHLPDGRPTRRRRQALDAEVAAIRSESPIFNRRSANPLMRDSCAPHESRMNASRIIQPRVGVGVRGGVGGGFGDLPNQVQTPTYGADRLARFGFGAAR